MRLGKEQQRLLDLLQDRGAMFLSDDRLRSFRKRVLTSMTYRDILDVQPTASGTLLSISLGFLLKLGYRAKEGLVYQGNRMLDCSEADRLARSVGCNYAENLVKALNKEQT